MPSPPRTLLSRPLIQALVLLGMGCALGLVLFLIQPRGMPPGSWDEAATCAPPDEELLP